MTRKDLQIQGVDHQPIAICLWYDDRPPKAVVQITHGMAEHIQRYDGLAEYLLGLGYAVIGHDHRGHGRSVVPGREGFFADQNGWDLVVSDLCKVNAFAKSQWPDTPVFLVAHSMGTYIAQAAMMRQPGLFNAAVLSGSGCESTAKLSGARLIAQVECRRQGALGRSKLIDRLSFGHFNQAFSPVRTSHDWLSRDPEQVDAYLADPRCGFLCTNQMWCDLLGGMIEINTPSQLKKLNPELPVLILGGDRDPVSAGGGLKKLARQLENAGVDRVDLKIWEGGRHEMLHELNRQRVFDYLGTWLDRFAPPRHQPAETRPRRATAPAVFDVA
jgi:alpha-beta hydrolase superfamily lysophospholipase